VCCCCLPPTQVFAHGLDLFFTRVTPSQTFDLLNEGAVAVLWLLSCLRAFVSPPADCVLRLPLPCVLTSVSPVVFLRPFHRTPSSPLCVLASTDFNYVFLVGTIVACALGIAWTYRAANHKKLMSDWK
jgi:hypothetical protein